MVLRMDALFLVDREARQQQFSLDERLAFRREHATPWLGEIRQECLRLSKTVLAKSPLGQAVSYTRNMWPKLERSRPRGQCRLQSVTQFCPGQKSTILSGIY
jgi:transposase